MKYSNIIERLVSSYKINLHEGLGFSDLPFFEKYISEIKLNKVSDAGTGISIKSKRIAKEKAVFESIERLCLFYDKKQYSKFILSSREEFKQNYLSLNNFQYFTKGQIYNNKKKLEINSQDKFYWVKGTNFNTKDNIFIPVQLIFLNGENKEKIIVQSISTGAAGGRTLNDAIQRGTFEIIERDAFMIHYLAKTYGELIDFSMNKRLVQLREYFRKYNLELYLISLPTDLGIYTMMSFIVDRTGLGVPFSAGMKTGLNPYKVAVGSIEESYMGINFSRNNLLDKDLKNIDEKNISTMKQRGLYWLDQDKLQYINPWIKNKRKIKFDKMKNFSLGSIDRNLKFVNNILKSKKHNIYYVDIKKEEFKKYSEFEIIKVVIPSLQPLYLNEKYKCLGGKRIYDVPVELGYYDKPLMEEELNQMPHFFL
ncbi:MAG: YcaO-like family protein [Patescibacteria group bacterium]